MPYAENKTCSAGQGRTPAGVVPVDLPPLTALAPLGEAHLKTPATAIQFCRATAYLLTNATSPKRLKLYSIVLQKH